MRALHDDVNDGRGPPRNQNVRTVNADRRALKR